MPPNAWENKGYNRKQDTHEINITCQFSLGLILIPSFRLAFLALRRVNPNISQKNIEITYLFLGHKFQDILKYGGKKYLGSTHFPPQFPGNCVMKQNTTK